jgi:integrase
LKSRAALTTAYAAGLRVSEAVSLKVGDIDSDRMLLQVRHGKGAKDRTVMLSAQLLAILRTYWRLTRPADWLFPGRGERPIDVTVLHSACRSATKAAGLTKKVSVHTLRHSFATHHGVVRWRLIDLARWLHDEFGVSLRETTVGRELKKLGYVKLTARPRHHAQNEYAMEAFKTYGPPRLQVDFTVF